MFDQVPGARRGDAGTHEAGEPQDHWVFDEQLAPDVLLQNEFHGSWHDRLAETLHRAVCGTKSPKCDAHQICRLRLQKNI